MAEVETSKISLPLFLAIAAAVIGALMLAVWFAIPGPNQISSFVSPSGALTLEIGEKCGDVSCSRSAVLQRKDADTGAITRLGCALTMPQTTPVLADAKAIWSRDETALDIDLTTGEIVSLVFERDCTITG